MTETPILTAELIGTEVQKMIWIKERPLPKIKPRPQYWRMLNILKKLRLKYREIDKETPHLHILVPDFGIVIKFNPNMPTVRYTGWDIMDVDLKQLELNDIKYGRELMWMLIMKGYMAYLRNDVVNKDEGGNSRLYRYFLIDEGWATRIIDKRLELYNNEPRHKFMIERNKRLRAMSVHYIVMHHPDFFDYLI